MAHNQNIEMRRKIITVNYDCVVSIALRDITITLYNFRDISGKVSNLLLYKHIQDKISIHW